jgi:hypothetical protein
MRGSFGGRSLRRMTHRRRREAVIFGCSVEKEKSGCHSYRFIISSTSMLDRHVVLLVTYLNRILMYQPGNTYSHIQQIVTLYNAINESLYYYQIISCYQWCKVYRRY